MQISWHGQYTIKITSQDTTLVIDPYSPKTGLPPFRAKANIVALSNPSNPEMSHISGVQKNSVIVKTPGEYSIQGITLHAIGWHAEDESERNLQRWSIEDMTVLHIGALNRKLLDTELQELEVTGIDILIIPVGGGTGFDTKQALQVVTTIEPRIVIPIHYAHKGDKEKLDSAEKFTTEMGGNPTLAGKKFSIRESKLPQEDVETVILTP